jgi:hypothetical protein
MKQFFFFFTMLASITASATVTITPLSVDYATKKVTFKVSWTNTPKAPYNNNVWVWVDLCPIAGTTPGTFAKAEISNPLAIAGNIATVSGNTRGFYITTNPSTVTATLNNASGKFNWCAYGSDYPPNATVKTGGYDLHGTPPFTINGNITENTKVFGAGTCITSITDLTGCPGIVPAAPTVGISASTTTQCPGNAITFTATPAGSSYCFSESGTCTTWSTTRTKNYTWTTSGTKRVYVTTRDMNNCTATNSVSVSISTIPTGATTFCGCSVWVADTDHSKSPYAAGSIGDEHTQCSNEMGSGWRAPFKDEMQCLMENRQQIPNLYTANQQCYLWRNKGVGANWGECCVVDGTGYCQNNGGGWGLRLRCIKDK